MDLSTTRAIDRRAPIAFYAQLKQILIEAMQVQHLSAGSLLPGDNELADHFKVSRSVVRQALAGLEADELIVRHRGKGTYIANDKVSEGLADWSGGLFDDARLRGSEVRSRVIRLETIPAVGRVARKLQLAEGASVVTLERVRCINSEPWVHTTTWLPHSLVPGLEEYDFRERSLYEVLRSEYGLVFGRVKRSIEASLAGDETGQFLGIDAGSPVLKLTSLLFDSLGAPIETFVAYHRGDRSRFDVDLDSDSNSRSDKPFALRAVSKSDS